MSELGIASIVFSCVFGSALLGLFLGKVLPEHHLSQDSKDVVKLGTALVATLAALVLGLLSPRQRARSTGRTARSYRMPPGSSRSTAPWPTMDRRRKRSAIC